MYINGAKFGYGEKQHGVNIQIGISASAEDSLMNSTDIFLHRAKPSKYLRRGVVWLFGVSFLFSSLFPNIPILICGCCIKRLSRSSIESYRIAAQLFGRFDAA